MCNKQNDFSFRIKRLRETLKMTQKEFAEKIGRSHRSVQEWESGRVIPPENILKFIETVFSVNPEWLRHGKGKMFLKKKPESNLKFLGNVESDFVLVPVPVISGVRAGRGLYPEINNPEEVEMFYVPTKRAEHRMFFFKVEGDSMNPRLKDGDWVLADLDSSVYSGDLAVVELTNGELMVKKFREKGDIVILENYNTDYEPIVVKESDIKNLAKVISILPKGES
ncbi:XRE family transcriptional regulator [Desulfurobacterium atlanticum]|uniref:Repressor LexA n=1 Tax=Desulfurobacterium atlanticum TaxID=240169 RepID=A0A238YSC3_9BACT|nr:XRE family transcriptional regulator [Desulfurobacterium atlanticum]SNR73591.1 repressor LexA [Desulfurobacterium atlanticum]